MEKDVYSLLEKMHSEFISYKEEINKKTSELDKRMDNLQVAISSNTKMLEEIYEKIEKIEDLIIITRSHNRY